MEDERKKTDAGAAGGTLKDGASGNGEETFGSLMMSGFGSVEKKKEPSGMEEAISTNYLLSGSQGRNEISEFLARRDGDSEVLADEDGAGRTIYQKRVLEAAKEARAKYFEAREARKTWDMAKYGAMLVRYADALTKEGLNEDPEVLDLIRQEEVEEMSIIFDAENAANVLKAQGKMFSEIDSAAAEEGRDIGGEIERELGSPETAPEELMKIRGQRIAMEAQRGGVHASEEDSEERERISESQIVEAERIGEEVAQPPALPEGEAEEDNSIDGRATDAPKPVAEEITDTRRERLAWEAKHKLPKVSAGEIEITPLGDEEKELLGKLEVLTSTQLREMAAKRREQAEIAFGSREKGRRNELGKWYVGFMVQLQDAGLDTEDSLSAMSVAKMELLMQADKLEIIANARDVVSAAEKESKAAPAEPIKPVRPAAGLRRQSAVPKPAATDADVDSWAATINEQEGQFFDKGDSGAFRAHMVGDVVRVEGLYGNGQGTASIATDAGHPQTNEEAVHVMGTGGKKAGHTEKTAIGMPAAGSIEAALDEVVAGEKPAENLGGTRIIGSGAGAEAERQTGLGYVGAKSEEGSSKDSLSRTGIFGQFDRDPEMAQIAEEGSGALRLDHIQRISGAMPVAAPDLKEGRIPTGQLPAVAAAVKRIAGLGDTNSGVTNEEAPEVPPYGVDPNEEKEPKADVAPDLHRTAVVLPDAISGMDGKPKVWAEEAFSQTRLSSADAVLGGAAAEGAEKATVNERPKEDFGVYGDVYYAVEKVLMESSGIPPSFDNMNNFPKILTDAITKAEQISERSKFDPRKGETHVGGIEDQRVARLKQFRADFLEIAEGQNEPKRGFFAYNEWLANKRREYSEISDVHELLSKALAGDLGAENKHGVSPGEYNRVAVLRLCNAAIKKGTLTEQEEARVEKLREILEPVSRGEKDIYAQTIAADAAYEMIVGFATKRERARTRQLEAELGKYKLTVAEYEGKRELMVKILAEVLVSVKNSESDSGKAKEKVKQAIMALAPDDPFERGKYIRMIRDAQAGEGGKAGAELRNKADKLAAETMDAHHEEAAKAVAAAKGIAAQAKPVGVAQSGKSPDQRALDDMRAVFYGETGPRRPQPQAIPAQKAPKQHGPVARSIGTAITMAAGAALLAGGLWLNQNGIITLGTRTDASAQAPVAAQVEKTLEETADELPAGVAMVDAGKASAKKVMAAVPAQKILKTDAGVVPDAGVDPLIKAVRGIQPVQPIAPEKYSRDKTGLKAALNDWCGEEHGLLVSGEMLRASYAAVEGGLDGKVLPQDTEWVPLMLGIKFPNRMIELSVMSDLARSDIDSVDRYAALMRLSIVLGDRAGNPKSFWATINDANKKGIALPALDKESHMGKIEGVKSGERCLFAAYHESVTARMAQIKKEAIESGMGGKEFIAAVSQVLGKDAKRIIKLYESANYQANQEESEGACKALTGGKRGAGALERALKFVLPQWEASHERAKAKAEKYQKGVDDVLGTAPKVKTNAPKHEDKKAATDSPCAGKENMAYFSCVNELNRERLREASKIGGAKKEGQKPKKQTAAAKPCEDLKGSFYYFKCLEEQKQKAPQGGTDSGEKKMPKPKGKEAGASSKAPRMFVRY